jgi:hypothetical protein
MNTTNNLKLLIKAPVINITATAIHIRTTPNRSALVGADLTAPLNTQNIIPISKINPTKPCLASTRTHFLPRQFSTVKISSYFFDKSFARENASDLRR